MSALSVRLPDSLHAHVREWARKEGISINQFISAAVAEKLAALATEEYLAARAARADRAAFESALAEVPDVPDAFELDAGNLAQGDAPGGYAEAF